MVRSTQAVAIFCICFFIVSIKNVRATISSTTYKTQCADGTSSADYQIPLGWAVMSPNMLIDHDDSWYGTFWFPCDCADKKIYCLQIVKNGISKSPVYRLDTYQGEGHIGQAYQPPVLFQSGNSRVGISHWALTDTGKSLVVTADIPVTENGFGSSWDVKGVFAQPASTFNYLGGAVGKENELVIAGWSQTEGLQVIKSLPPYSSWLSTATEFLKGQAALYSHVAVASDSRIGILSTHGFGSVPCTELGKNLTNYKNIHYYESSFSSLNSGIKISDEAPDFRSASDWNPCAWRNMRFPLDLLYDSGSDRFLMVTLRSDLRGSYTDYSSNDKYTQVFRLQASDGSVFIPDLSVYFDSLQLSGNDFDGFKVTRIRSGEYAVVGSSFIDKRIAVVFTRDFRTFSAPQSLLLSDIPDYSGLDTSHGSYIRPHVFQPDKNSRGITPSAVHLWFAPYTYNQPNYWLRYTHAVITSNLEKETAGDLTGDHRVDLADYNALVKGYGTKYTQKDVEAVMTNFGI